MSRGGKEAGRLRRLPRAALRTLAIDAGVPVARIRGASPEQLRAEVLRAQSRQSR